MVLFASAHIVCVFDLKEITLFIRVTVVTYVNAFLGNFYAILNFSVWQSVGNLRSNPTCQTIIQYYRSNSSTTFLTL